MAYRRATITLYIDPDAFEQDIGEELDNAILHDLGQQANQNVSHMGGYEAWQVGWMTVDDAGYIQREFIDFDNTEEG